MIRIVGRFYLVIGKDGNLSGKFSNNLHLINFPESAIKVSGAGILGIYNSTWTDETGTYNASLSILLKLNSTEIYSLRWSNGTVDFYGEAILFNDILIGDYRNYEFV